LMPIPIARQTDPLVPYEFRVTKRAELDAIVRGLQTLVAKHPELELWMRGQDNEYLLDDLTEEAIMGICPWRSIREASLVPSLYRGLLGKLSDRREYGEYCLEFARLGLFLDHDLRLTPYSTRAPLDAPEELPGDHWGVTPPFASIRHDAAGNPTSVRDYHVVYRALQKLFFFQHYSLPSSILDVTSDLDVALFFARHKVVDRRYVRIDRASDRPVLYLFIVNRQLDLVLDSAKLCEHYGLLRPLRQKCGLLAGASLVNRNDYSRLLAVRFRLEGPILQEEGLQAAHLFPTPEEDPFLARLLAFTSASGLTRMGPLVPA